METVSSLQAVSEYLAEQVFEVENVRFVDSDADLGATSFDAVAMCNAVSHIAGLARVLVRTADLLKPGGRLFVEDNNNKRGLLIRYRQRREWRASDRGACERRQTLDPSREHLTYGLGSTEIERWRGRDLSQLSACASSLPTTSRAACITRTGSHLESWSCCCSMRGCAGGASREIHVRLTRRAQPRRKAPGCPVTPRRGFAAARTRIWS